MKKQLNLITMEATLKASKNDEKRSFIAIQKQLIEKGIQKESPYLSIGANIAPIINGIGIDTSKLTAKEIMIRLINLMPFVQESLHLWQYGRPAFGKTFMLAKVLSPTSKAISGKITGPQLFGDIKKGEEGLVAIYKALGFEDIQSFNLATEELGAILDFLTTGETRLKNISDSTNDSQNISKVYSTSFIFNGNFEDNVEKELQKNPYICVKELLNTSFTNKFSQENFKTRIVCVPTWLSRNLIPISDTDYETIGYQIEFFQKECETLKNITLDYDLKEPNKNPRLNTNIRKLIYGFYKLCNFSQLILGKSPITTQVDMEGFEFIAKKLVELPFSDSKFTLVGNTAVNQLWIKLSEHLMKYPLSSIVEAYVDENRITVRFEEEKDSYFKIALDSQGIFQNKAEVKVYEEIPELYKEDFVPIYAIKNDYTVVVAKTNGSIFSSYQEVKNIKEILKKDISIASIASSMDNPQLIEYLKVQAEKNKNRANELQNELNVLKNFILNSFSKNERMASKNTLLTTTEKKELTYEIIDYLADILSIPKDNFKSYHFVFNEKDRTVQLLHYYYLQF